MQTRDLSTPRERDAASALTIALILLALSVYYVLIDTHFRYNFEFDSYINRKFVLAFADFFKSGDWSRLPPLGRFPPYFDAPFLIYTAMYGATEILCGTFSVLASLLPSVDERIHFAIRISNYLFLAAASVLFSLSILLLTRNALAALVIGLLFLLCPIFYLIDLTRQDHLILFLLNASLYLVVRIGLGLNPVSSFYLLAVTTAFLVLTKLNAPVFGIYFLAGSAFLVRKQRWTMRRAMGHVMAGWLLMAVFVTLLSFRYFYYASDLIPFLRFHMNEQAAWGTQLRKSSSLYYAWGALDVYGPSLRYILWAAFFLSLLAAFATRNPLTIFLVATTAFYVILSLPSYQTPRGGYHLIPLFLALLAVSYAFLAQQIRVRMPKARWATFLPVAAALIVVEPIASTIRTYLSNYETLKFREISVQTNRIKPRSWIIEHLGPGARVLGTQWSIILLPDADASGLVLDWSLLNVPFIDGEALSKFPPPSYDELVKTGDVLILSDFDRVQILSVFETYGLPDMAKQWEEFFSTLRSKFSRVTFTAPTIVYSVKEVELFALRSSPPTTRHENLTGGEQDGSDTPR